RTARGGHHPHHVFDVQVDARQRAVELGVPEGEKAPVGAPQVVTPAVGGGGDGHYVADVLAELGQVAVELGVTEAGHGAVGRDYPVALGTGGGGYAYHRAGSGRRSHAAEPWRCSPAV